MTALDTVAELMEIAATTAPKTKGDDFVVVSTVAGEDLRRLGEGMIAYGERHGRTNWDRDGRNVLDSGAVVLIGIKDAEVADLNCGACGEEACVKINTHEGEFKGPQCALRVLDMGIALGSAVKVAGMLNVDNRIMYRVGVVARELGLIDADFVMGIPLSVTGKSIYFDRRS
ncbi:MAG TPA: hypothetical protein ENL35_12105 [Chloroflexi bacterium]|nr:hypothetical protein [Chloroflexota bacterium]